MARPEFEVPEFVSESDSDQIQERMMGNLPADISDMEGDFPYDFTMPTAIEISQLVQFNLVRCLMVAFPEYSWGDWMDLHGAEAGVTRKEAVAATGTVSVFQVASIPGRGQAYGKKYIERWMSRDPEGTKYCVQSDIKKCYPSMSHDKILEFLRRDLVKKNQDTSGGNDDG